MAECLQTETENKKRFTIPLKQIPRFSVNDSQANALINSREPVIITDTHLVSSACNWELDYLSRHIGDGLFTVYRSKSHKFKYYSDKKSLAIKEFTPPTSQEEMPFQEFVTLIKSHPKSSSERIYLQQALNNSVGPKIVEQFVNFNWSYVTGLQRSNNWGPLTSNLLLVGMPGNVTPVHYDEQENMFAQIRGSKRLVLFNPDQFENLYPYPVHHPHDRQSQVDLDNPDLNRFPNVTRLCGYEGVVGPGEVIYIPMYWWHQVESMTDSEENISVNFWYMAGNNEKIEYPLSAQQKVSMTRNIEKMILQALNDADEVAPFMRMMVLGRYT